MAILTLFSATWLSSHCLVRHGYPHTVWCDMAILTSFSATWLSSHRLVRHGYPHIV